MMGSRGVSRPVAEKEMRNHHDHDDPDGGQPGMSDDERMSMLKMHHKQTLCPSETAFSVTCTIMAIAVILLSIPRGQVIQTYGTWDRFVR